MNLCTNKYVYFDCRLVVCFIILCIFIKIDLVCIINSAIISQVQKFILATDQWSFFRFPRTVFFRHASVLNLKYFYTISNECAHTIDLRFSLCSHMIYSDTDHNNNNTYMKWYKCIILTKCNCKISSSSYLYMYGFFFKFLFCSFSNDFYSYE